MTSLEKRKANFLRRAHDVHGDKYDYSEVNYVDNKTRIRIICPIHGAFMQLPSVHLSGSGCRDCGIERVHSKQRKTTEQFIEEARKIHGDKYDYSKVNYVKNDVNVCIVCPKHGEFWQTPNNHLNGKGCLKCAGKDKTTEEFIEELRCIYGDKYDYSKVEYIGSKIKVCVTCEEHGDFTARPNDLLKGEGCPTCGKIRSSESKKLWLEKFIERAKEIHGDKYDYSKVEYIKNKVDVCIICPIHGEFWQTPEKHLKGEGCTKCNSSHLENEVRRELSKVNVIFEEQKRFEWLGKQKLDFFLPQYNMAIECQGEQHFKPIKHFGGENEYEEIKKRDILKKELCEKNGIKLKYFSHLKYKSFLNECVHSNFDVLIKEIIKGE